MGLSINCSHRISDIRDFYEPVCAGTTRRNGAIKSRDILNVINEVREEASSVLPREYYLAAIPYSSSKRSCTF